VSGSEEVIVKKLNATLQEAGIDASSLALAYTVNKQRIYRLTVSGEDAISTWEQLREAVSNTRHWPVLMGTDEDLEILADNLEWARRRSPAKILKQAQEADVEELLAECQRAVVENVREALEEFREDGDSETEAEFERMLVEGPFQGMPRGTWPAGKPARDDFTIPYDIMTDEVHEHVHIGLLPTENGWEAPGYLKLGGWNACPHPHYHVAIMHSWHERYGAEVVGITPDVVELRVARPPRKRADALALAREQYLYCGDIVDQGTETLDSLAAELLGATAWYFWWD
jgi:hypothetical protein